MPTGNTVASPPLPLSSARTTFAPTRGSPLNPLSRPHPPSQSLKPTATTTTTHTPIPTHTHLANLDRILRTPAEPQTQITYDSASEPNRPNSETRSGSDGGGVGLFNALNLPSLFPSMRKPSEDMSPRSLTHLQRLLSLSPRLSPKSSIASRWRHFHGATDWAGLLDPLDENLRRELVRYGDLVQAAYHAFHSNPTASPSRNRHVVLPDRSYHVTKSLYATSSVDLPKWVDGVAPWMNQRSSWIGYVAVCDSDREIHRMGRRDIVIALRGTATSLEWIENLRAGLVPISSKDGEEKVQSESRHEPKVACGFLSLFETAGPQVPSLSTAVVEEVRRLMDVYKGEELSITVTGHSLGAALALLVADELRTCVQDLPPVAVVSFGGPRVGNQGFVDRLDGKGIKVLRVVNAHDVITRVPGVLPRAEIGRRLGKGWGSHVLEGMDGYAHVGTEFRVDSRESPYLRSDADPSCCHDLEAYLHLVDGYMGTGCPFRSEAKRSLVRLLNHQRPNLKKLYVSHPRAFGADPFAASAARSNVPAGCLASPSG